MSLKKALLKREEQIRYGAEIAAQETNDFAMVKEYILNRTRDLSDLNERQRKTLDAYKFMYSQLITGKFDRTDIITMAQKFFNISYPTALKYLKDAKELFGTVYQIDKQFELKLQLDLNRKMLSQAANSNLDTYARLEKNRLEILKEIEEIEEDKEEFTGIIQIAEVNPELLGFEYPDDEEVNELLDDIQKKYGGERFEIAGVTENDNEDESE